jgi:Zn2+/Cd2+-exporting ATPase
MVCLGGEVTIGNTDIIIQTDQPSKIARTIKIGRSTRKIVWQNIALAFGVKITVMAFADVGVALLAILNAVRLQKMKWQN